LRASSSLTRDLIAKKQFTCPRYGSSLTFISIVNRSKLLAFQICHQALGD
jgi:hypothetical protein